MGTNIAVTRDSFFTSNKKWIKARLGLDVMRSITLDLSAFTVDHIQNGKIPSGTVLASITAGGKYGPYDPGAKVNEQQSIIATGGTVGDFTLGFFGETTAAIAFNATAAAVQAALELLPNINPGDIVVAGGPLPETAVTVTFGGQYAGMNVPLLVVTDNITNGTATVTTPTAGSTTGADTVAGTSKAEGHLFEDVPVSLGQSLSTMADVGAALFWMGIVDESALPDFTDTAAGLGELDAAAKTALPNIRYE